MRLRFAAQNDAGRAPALDLARPGTAQFAVTSVAKRPGRGSDGGLRERNLGRTEYRVAKENSCYCDVLANAYC